MAASLSLTALPGIPRVGAGADLAAIILAGIEAAGLRVEDGDIFVLAQKIVSKAEGRMVRLGTVTPGPDAVDIAAKIEKDPRLVQLILNESSEVLRVRPGVIVVVHRLGFVLANAGIDASNVDADGSDDVVLLLPENPDASCQGLRQALETRTGRRLGIVINDSFGRAWRNGTIGTAIGAAGLPTLVDLRGRPDMNGRILRVTELGAADELAAAASLLMGQAAEGTPVIHVRGYPYGLGDGDAKALIRPKAIDMFR